MWLSKVSLAGMNGRFVLDVAGYKIGKTGWGHIVETLSVYSGAGLKPVGSDVMADLESCSLSPSLVFPPPALVGL